MIRLAQIWRYPLKAIGRQKLDRVKLTKGERLPFDRHWAVMHEASAEKLGDADGLEGWMPKSAFLRGAAGPSLQAISGGLSNGKLMLSHPDQADISVDPTKDEDEARLIDWLRPLWPEDKPAPSRLVSGSVPLTDAKNPYVSINSLESLREIEIHVGHRIGVERWRGNLWIEGGEPFEELDWIGREIRIGAARLIVREPIGRCAATAVDTETGRPDRSMVQIVNEKYDHTNFGVYAEVIDGADIAPMDEVIVADAPAPDPNAADGA